jgi:hypothetical protein
MGGIVVYANIPEIPATQEGEAGGSPIQEQPGQS